ncbi:unnamed protein product [Polarella glacialis]|uniref:Uncharacterized protein n=1 Tax=Polarella glacialis TaxID=89957 RepID=A0A813IR27_POLGL|nr:unnamed protein product [Polarella glacialis]
MATLSPIPSGTEQASSSSAATGTQAMPVVIDSGSSRSRSNHAISVNSSSSSEAAGRTWSNRTPKRLPVPPSVRAARRQPLVDSQQGFVTPVHHSLAFIIGGDEPLEMAQDGAWRSANEGWPAAQDMPVDSQAQSEVLYGSPPGARSAAASDSSANMQAVSQQALHHMQRFLEEQGQMHRENMASMQVQMNQSSFSLLSELRQRQQQLATTEQHTTTVMTEMQEHMAVRSQEITRTEQHLHQASTMQQDQVIQQNRTFLAQQQGQATQVANALQEFSVRQEAEAQRQGQAITEQLVYAERAQRDAVIVLRTEFASELQSAAANDEVVLQLRTELCNHEQLVLQQQTLIASAMETQQ